MAFRASSTLAHTDTKSACTAQDIEVTGGTIINEPCTCASGGTFQAVAEFQVTNNNNAARKCITLHLGAGGTFGGQDFLLTDANGSSNIAGSGTTKTMFAQLGTVSCNFAGECYSGSVIAFQTAKNQADTACEGPLTKYPGGQCRRQTICIVGFAATLDCDPSTTAIDSNCTVPCGGSISLLATATGGTTGSNGTYTFTLTDPNGATVQTIGPGASSPQTFTFTPTVSGTYTLTVTDSQGCTRTATVTLTVSTITASLTGAAAGDCTASGTATFTASSTGTGSCTYQFLVDGTEVQAASSSNTFDYHPVGLGTVDDTDHTVTVNVNCGGCTASASATVHSCIHTTVS